MSDLLVIKCGLSVKFCLRRLHFWLKTSFSLKEVTLHKALKVELWVPVVPCCQCAQGGDTGGMSDQGGGNQPVLSCEASGFLKNIEFEGAVDIEEGRKLDVKVT